MGNVEVYRMESWRFRKRLQSCGSTKLAVVSIIIYLWIAQCSSIQKSARTKHPKGGSGWFVPADLHMIQNGRSISSWKDELDAHEFKNWGWKTASHRLLKKDRLACQGKFFLVQKNTVFPVLSGFPWIAPILMRFQRINMMLVLLFNGLIRPLLPTLL